MSRTVKQLEERIRELEQEKAELEQFSDEEIDRKNDHIAALQQSLAAEARTQLDLRAALSAAHTHAQLLSEVAAAAENHLVATQALSAHALETAIDFVGAEDDGQS